MNNSFMKFLVCGLSMAVFFLHAARASAGNSSGGGGKGVLCGSQLRSLDLYEAEEIYHLRAPSDSYRDLDSSLAVYGKKLSDYYLDDDKYSQQITSGLVSMFRDIPAGTTIPLSPDATLPKLLPGCSVVQIAYYDDATNMIQRDLPLWNRLSIRDQTALVLHEGLFWWARKGQQNTSDDARRLVGLLMSDQKLTPRYEPMMSAPRKLFCMLSSEDATKHEQFELFDVVDEVQNGQAGIGIYFSDASYDGAFHMFRTMAFVSRLSLDSLMHDKISEIQTTARREFSDASWNIKIVTHAAKDLGITPPIGPDYDFQVSGPSGRSTPSSGFCSLLGPSTQKP